MDYTFLTDNYVWIIVIAVIIVMTIIGYIADKTKFGEKKEQTKKIKPVQEIESTEETNAEESQMDDFTTEEPQMDDFTTEESQMDNFMTEEPTDPEVTYDENLDSNFEMPTESTENETEPFEPVAPLQEEVQEEPMNFEMPMETEEVQQEEIVPENSSESSSEVSEPVNMPVEENSISETIFPEESTEEDFGLPSIDTLNQEIAEVEDDEDVWKF